VFFEGKNNHVLSCFETDNEETTLFGKKVFSMTEQEIIELMKEEGLTQIDTEEEEWGEKRVSFDEGLIDFYFQDGKLVTVNWGVFVNEDGEIEEFDEEDEEFADEEEEEEESEEEEDTLEPYEEEKEFNDEEYNEYMDDYEKMYDE